jgi:hypothetical protein
MVALSHLLIEDHHSADPLGQSKQEYVIPATPAPCPRVITTTTATSWSSSLWKSPCQLSILTNQCANVQPLSPLYCTTRRDYAVHVLYRSPEFVRCRNGAGALHVKRKQPRFAIKTRSSSKTLAKSQRVFTLGLLLWSTGGPHLNIADSSNCF